MMTDESALLRLAERLRKTARDTEQLHYVNLMLRAARELETHACALRAGHPGMVPANDQTGNDRDSYT